MVEAADLAAALDAAEGRHAADCRGGVVVVHPVGEGGGYTQRHEHATRAGIAERLAALKGFDFAETYVGAPSSDGGGRAAGPVYFVPSDTLVGFEAARALGIRDEDDLFGGVVPHAFVVTKTITHPLAGPGARAPAGWSEEFGRRVRGSVLRGFSAFAAEDARAAGERLLALGAVRLKPARATGGRGQTVARDAAGLDAALRAMDPGELAGHGLVLEENLADLTTHSVGQVRAAGLVATYWGTQRVTPDNGGESVYGGSDLLVARGGFEALLGLDLSPEARAAVSQACVYDEAASACFPGMFASRRNYDVAQGIDAEGRPRSGVLEQSWRVGGASGAEVAALEAFRAGPGLRAVRASTVEVYGAPLAEPPPGAAIYFRGVDERVGPITKYATAEPAA